MNRHWKQTTRWSRGWLTPAVTLATLGTLVPALAPAAGLNWPTSQVLPSFSAPAATLDLMDVTSGEFRYDGEGSQLRHSTGHLDGDGWLAQVSVDAPNQFMAYGPYATDIPAGANTAWFDLKIDNTTGTNAVVVTVDVRDNVTGAILAKRDISRADFTQASVYQRFTLPFTNATAGNGLEFRVYWYGGAYIKLDAIGVPNTLKTDEAVLFTSLKGLVNRTQPRIYSYDDTVRGNEGKYNWLNSLGLQYTEPADKWSLVGKYKNEIAGMVIYDPSVPDTLNLATTIASLKNGVVAPPSLVARLQAAPYYLTTLTDLRGTFTSKTQVYQSLYDNYWSQVTHRLLVGLDPGIKGNLRDYATAAKTAVVWLDPRVAAENTLLQKFLANMPNGSGLYMGWWPEEASGVQAASTYGVSTVASDWASNLSVFGGMSRTVTPRPIANKPVLGNKIYVTLILSDGDNLQYVEHHFKQLWDSSARGQVPLGWTISPAMLDAMPGLLNYLHGTSTPNDTLLSGPSGIGYTYPNYWGSQSYLDSFVSLSNDYLNRAGLRIVTVWNTINGGMNANVGNSFAYNAPSLLGTTAENAGGSITVYNNVMPSQGLTATYCPSESSMISQINSAISGWNGTSPRFVSIQANPWEGNTYQSFVNVVNNFKSNANIVFVRPDNYFQLLRETNNLPTDPSTLLQTAEAENTSYATSPFSHGVGRSSDNGWTANTAQDAAGMMLYGPYVSTLPAGALTTTFRMKIDAITGNNDNVVTLDVRDATTGTLLSTFDVYRAHFKAAGAYQDFSLSYTNTAGHQLEFRANYKKLSTVNIDKVTTTTRIGQYEAEGSVVAHHVGRSSGDGWQANTAQDAVDHLSFGPYDANVPIGPRKVTFRLKTDNNALGAQGVVNIDVRDDTTGQSLAAMDVTAQQFTAANQYQDFSLTFNQTTLNHPLEYRVYYYKKSTITLDKITLN